MKMPTEWILGKIVPKGFLLVNAQIAQFEATELYS